MSTSPRPAHAWIWLATVVRWVDGDTVVLRVDRGFHDSSEVAVRLLGLNAPELNAPDEGTRFRAQTSKARAEALAPAGSAVTIRTHKNGTDRYGRWLAEVWAGPLSSVNEALVVEGLAVAETR